MSSRHDLKRLAKIHKISLNQKFLTMFLYQSDIKISLFIERASRVDDGKRHKTGPSKKRSPP